MSLLTKIPFTLPIFICVACGLNSPGNIGDDDAGVDPTPDDENVPQFVDAHYLLDATFPYSGDQPNALNGVWVDAELAATPPGEREYAAFVPSTPPQPDHTWIDGVYYAYIGWPSKPSMKGLPELPYADFVGVAADGLERSRDEYGHSQGDLRSGLIGGFAMNTPTLIDGVSTDPCGTAYPRAPICSPLLAQIGHPFVGGRYNQYGVPCSIAPGTLEFSGIEYCEAHFAVGVHPASPQYPILGPAVTDSECLAMGKTYRFERGLLTAGERGGMTWINIREMGDLIAFVADTLSPVTELLEAIPWWDYAQSQWNYIPEDVPWRWSEFSATATCAFAASLMWASAEVNGSLVPCYAQSLQVCPKTHFAVLPPFNSIDQFQICFEDGPTASAIYGFCALADYDWIAGEASVQEDGSIDPIVQSDISSGYHRRFNLRFDAMSDEMVDDWAAAITLTPSDEGVIIGLVEPRWDDLESLRLHLIGRALLDEFELEAGDRITSIDSDIDLRSADVDVAGAFLTVVNRFAGIDRREGSTLGPQVVSLMIERDDGMVLPTYLFPVIDPPAPTGDGDTTDGTEG